MKVYIMIGLIGSGKSSWARMTAGSNFSNIRISLDDIRDMIKDGYIFDLQLEPLVRNMSRAMILTTLENGKNVIVDDCNLVREHRLELCHLIKKQFPDVEIQYVWIQAASDVALKRRLADNSRGQTKFVWQQVLKKMVISFDHPEDDAKFLQEMDIVPNVIKVENNG